MGNKFHSYIFTLLLITFTAYFSKAQYPVQVLPQIISPASLSLSDYYSSTIPKLFVTLTNRDLQKPTLQVKLRVKISSGSVLLTTNESKNYTPITLDPGIPKRLFSNDLEQYLNPANLRFQGITQQQYLSKGLLPEGMYSFCFEVIESSTNRVLSQPNQCAMVWISLTDPPLLNMPLNKSDVIAKEPTFIVFSWTPRHQSSPNSATNTEYEFEMVELLDKKVDPNAAFTSSRVLYKTRQMASSLVYGPGEPLLIPGKRYGWRVRLVPIDLTQDFDEFRNNGYSDIYSFDYKGDCPQSEIVSAVVNGNSADITWSKKKDYATYQVKYRPANQVNATPKFVTANGTSAKISNLLSDTRYAIWISYLCVDGSEVSSDFTYMDVVGDGINSGPTDKKTPTDDIVNSLKAEVKGEVKWSYIGKGSTDKIDFNKTNQVSTKELLTPYDKNDNAQLFAGADVKLFLIKRGNRTLVSTTKSDSKGAFKLSTVKEIGEYELEYSHATGCFATQTQKVTIDYDSKTKIFNCTDNAVMLAKTMELKPAILATGFTTDEIAKMSIDVLIESSVWNRTYGNIAGQLDVSGAQIVSYNNNSYNILATLKNNNEVGRFLQNTSNTDAYIARITIPGGAEYFAPIDAVTDAQRVNKTFTINVKHAVSGKVSFDNKSIEQVKIIVSIKEGDIATNTNNSATELTYVAMTDATGSYYIDIPRLKKGAPIKISAIDYSISTTPFKGEVLFGTKTLYTYDFVLKAQSYTYVGRVTSPEGYVISNALVTVSGGRAPVRTTKDGFFIVQGNLDAASKITISADGFYEISVPVFANNPLKLNPRGTNPAAEWANGVKSHVDVIKFLKENSNTQADAGLFMFNRSNDNLDAVYSQLGTIATEEIAGILNLTNLNLKPTHFVAEISVKMGNELIAADIEINQNGSNLAKLNTLSGKSTLFKGPPGNYTYSVKPKTDGPVFISVQNGFELLNKIGDNQKFVIIVDQATLTSFVVKSKTDNKPIEGALIKIEGISESGTTDKEGKAKVLIPDAAASSFKITASKANYNAVSQMVKSTDLQKGDITYLLEEIIDVPVKKISGFDVVIASQVNDPSQPNVVKVSGQLLLPSNDVFKVTSPNDKIEFKNVLVKLVDKNGGAVALSDIGFESATLRAKVFGGVPVEIDQVYLSKLEGRKDYENAVIRGSKARTVFATVPIKTVLKGLFNAYLIDSAGFKQEWKTSDAFKPFLVPMPTGVPLNSVVRAFVSPGIKINALSKDKIFKLHFDLPLGYKGDSMEVKLISDLNIHIKLFEAHIQKGGLFMKGSLKVPKALSQRADNNGRMTLSMFTIKNTLDAIDIGFDISKTKPFFMQLQKITAKVTNVGIIGLGSVNCGVSLGGEVWLTQKDRESRDSAGVLIVKSLSFVNKSDGVTLAGAFILPTKGISIKSLTFKTDNGKSMSFSYNFGEKTFEFQAAGILTYEGGTNLVARKLFPLEIQAFSLKTKTWSVLLVARPNKQIDFGVIKINLTALLVNIGYKASLDQMGAMLTNPKLVGLPDLGGPDDLVQEAKTSWAIGISGSIEFPIKDLQVEAGATVVFGNINGKIDFKINEILLKVVRDPTFTLEARVAMSFSGDKTGFAAAAKMVVLGNGLDASFKYWKYNTGGFELGASIAVSSKAGVITGPVTWLKIGGGFNFNTASKIYEVWLNGEVTNTGGQREAMYVMIDKLGILFAVNQCGAKPVIEGNGGLYIKNEQWLQVKIKADFCRMMFLLDLKGMIPTLPGLTKIDVQGTIFAAAAWNGQAACMFIFVNAKMNFTFINGNITFAIGVNLDKNRRDLPTEVKVNWAYIGMKALERNGQYFNAYYVGAFLDFPKDSGSFNVSLGRFKILGLKYKVYGNASAEFYRLFSRTELGFSVKLDAEASGKVTILGSSLNGAAKIVASLNGGYNQVWYLNGTVNASMSVWFGYASCNSVAIKWGGCFNIPNLCCRWVRKWWGGYPKCSICSYTKVCPIPVGISGAKICLGVKAGFDYKQGRQTKISLGK